MERPSRLPLYVGVLLAACGWAAIGAGWYQAGQQSLETGQMPFVLSGGFGGWGLLLMGAVGVLMDTIRQASWRAQVRHSELISALTRDPGEPSDEQEEAEEEAERPKAKTSSARRKRSRARRRG